MPAADSTAQIRILVPTAAETDTARPRRVRLAKALAATGAGKPGGMVRLPKQAKPHESRMAKRKPDDNRCKLAADELIRLAELKRRLKALGTRVKRRELLRAGLLLLAAMNDMQLKQALGTAGAVDGGPPPQQAS